MELITFASGSTGNCALIDGGETKLLIDAGISFLKIKTFLQDVGCVPEDISGILITHEHNDHIKGLPTLLKHTEIPLYAPRTVASELWRRLPESDGKLNIIPVEESFSVGNLKVTAFETPHDTPQSVGYRLSDGVCSLGICTDLGHVPENVRAHLLGVDAALIECNHDPTRLKLGSYPLSLKRRILSDRGHLSNEACAAFAVELASMGTAQLVLGHISKESNTPKLALKTVGEALEKAGYENVFLTAAPPEGLLSISVKGGKVCLPSN